MCEDNDNDNVVSHALLERIKQKKEQHKQLVPEEIKSIMDELLKPDDLAGFLRVIEVLRAIGDRVEISADIISVMIKCEQTASYNDFEEETMHKLSGALQSVTFDFDCIHMHDDEVEDGAPFATYVEDTAPLLRKAIESLTYWDDGKNNDDTTD